MKRDNQRTNISLKFWSLSLLCFQIIQFAYAHEPSSFVRFIPGASDWEGELQTSIVSFSNSLGTKLDLVSAVHLGDKDYYEKLNAEFRSKDTVLYELVAEVGQKPLIDSKQSNSSPVSILQKAMGNFLSLSFQLEEIDYTPENFTHADLNPSQLRLAMEAKDQNLLSTFLALAAAQSSEYDLEESNQEPIKPLGMMSLLSALTSGDHVNSLKYLFGTELGKAEGMRLTEEIENEIPILGERNRAVINRLVEVVSDSENKHIAIFYGAAHMPGIERSITKELGFRRESLRWLSAWRIP